MPAAISAAPMAPLTWAWVDTRMDLPDFFSSARTTPIFLATPPVITRLLSHALFAALSGIMISFRKYPGRTERERILHMKRIARMVEGMLLAYMRQDEQEA